MSPGEATPGDWGPEPPGAGQKPSAGVGGAGGYGQPLTVDEAQAGRVEQVLLQVVLAGAAVLPAQHLLPAGHRPHEGQVVAAAVVAQQCLHLGGAGHRGGAAGGHRRTGGGEDREGEPEAGGGAGLTLSTSARFCRLLLKGSRVRQETTTSSGCRHRKMAASTMALASRGSVEMWARRCPRVVRYSRWSSTPERAPRSDQPLAATPQPSRPRPLTDLLEQDHGLVHRLDVGAVHGLGEELHRLWQEPSEP